LGPFGSGSLSIAIEGSGSTVAVRLDNSAINYSIPQLSANTWTYFAISRSGTTENVFVGTGGTASQVGQQTDNRNYTGATTYVGYTSVFLSNASLVDLKVNIGTTYINPTSSSISVPTSKLTTNAQTVMLFNALSSGQVLVDTSGIQTATAPSSISFNISSPYPH